MQNRMLQLATKIVDIFYEYIRAVPQYLVTDCRYLNVLLNLPKITLNDVYAKICFSLMIYVYYLFEISYSCSRDVLCDFGLSK